MIRFVRLLVFTLEVAVACMSRFVDQFVLLFDTSKPPILVSDRTDTKYNACATLRSPFRSWWSICPLLLKKRKKNQGREAAFAFVGMPFPLQVREPGTLSRSVQRVVW